MSEYAYSIIMHTQLGPKYGNMRFAIKMKKIHGTLYILEKEESITGKLLEDGKCRLHGRIVSPARTLEYIAEGYFNNEKIELTLCSQRDRLLITGTASQSITDEII